MVSDLLCIGLTTLDIVGRTIDAIPDREGTTLIDAIEVVPAGTAGGTAMVAARLGVTTALASIVGDDRNGASVRRMLADAGVDMTWLRTLPNARTSATILTIDSHGRRPNFHALGAAMAMAVNADLIAAAARARFVHWGGIGAPRLNGGSGAALLAAARKAGATITCDLIGPSPATHAELAIILPHVDYFLPSAGEAIFLTGAADLWAAADTFVAMGAGACIIKDGERGSLLVDRDGSRHLLPAHVVDVVDTTSCGDSYCAGFIAALLRGWPVIEACRFATATAALVAQDLGTTGSLIDFASTAAAMATLPVRSPR